MGGGDRAYHLDSVQRVLAGGDRLGRKVLFVQDRDELGKRRLAMLAEERSVILSRRELENYLRFDTLAVVHAMRARVRQAPEAAQRRR